MYVVLPVLYCQSRAASVIDERRVWRQSEHDKKEKTNRGTVTAKADRRRVWDSAEEGAQVPLTLLPTPVGGRPV